MLFGGFERGSLLCSIYFVQLGESPVLEISSQYIIFVTIPIKNMQEVKEAGMVCISHIVM